ncbi:hypothetical protein B0H19DRAFT_1231789 [Mycena capillaripes]|nr:hypothetical protein B0H19DRAFT_1231789 [Mycena capillaripes]
MQSILRTTESAAVISPSPPRVQRVAFFTDHAQKPISKIDLKAFKGEWSMFKRPRQNETGLSFSKFVPHKTRLGALFLERRDRSLEKLSAKAGSKLSGGWGYFSRHIVEVKPRPRIPSKPSKIHKTKPTAQVVERRLLRRKSAFGGVYPAKASSTSTRAQGYNGTYRNKALLKKARGGKERRVLQRTRAIQRD